MMRLGRNLKEFIMVCFLVLSQNSDCVNSDKFSTFAAYKASDLRIIVNNELGRNLKRLSMVCFFSIIPKL
jgi:hypothetical protein